MSNQTKEIVFKQGHAIFVSSRKEQKALISFLEDCGFKLLYEELRKSKYLYPCWCVQGNSFALIGTQALKGIKKEKIFQNLGDFRKYFELI